MKAEWIALGVGVLLPIIGWGASVETRLASANKIEALGQRVEQLEQALLPVLVEYHLQLKMKAVALPSPAPVPSPSRPTKAMSIEFDDTKARGDAERWARSQLPNVQQSPMSAPP